MPLLKTKEGKASGLVWFVDGFGEGQQLFDQFLLSSSFFFFGINLLSWESIKEWTAPLRNEVKNVK